jgi:putative pre-16S rRNA nuclease
MRVAAIDLGKVRVGVAISDELGVLAHPRDPLGGGNQKRLLQDLVALAKAEGLGRFLVGLPLNRTGGEGREAARARRFAQTLADATGLEVELVDERFSTVEATRRLAEGGVSARDRRPIVDSASAAVLLQAWLDARSSEKGPAGPGP